MNIESLKGAVMADSVYVGGVQIGHNCEIKLPEVTYAKTEVKGASGIIELPIYSKTEAMECSVSTSGIDEGWLASIKPEPFDLIANIVQQSVAPDGTQTPQHFKAFLRVAPNGIPALEASYGESMDTERTFSVFSYRLDVDGKTRFKIDPIKGNVEIGGKNYADSVSKML